MPDDNGDITPGELRRWLGRLDKRVESLDTKVSSLDTDLRDRLDRIDKVSREEWKDGRATDRLYEEETRRIAASARTVSWAVLVLLFPLVIAIALALLGIAG